MKFCQGVAPHLSFFFFSPFLCCFKEYFSRTSSVALRGEIRNSAVFKSDVSLHSADLKLARSHCVKKPLEICTPA